MLQGFLNSATHPFQAQLPTTDLPPGGEQWQVGLVTQHFGDPFAS